jgi:hypothetical protein
VVGSRLELMRQQKELVAILDSRSLPVSHLHPLLMAVALQVEMETNHRRDSLLKVPSHS